MEMIGEDIMLEVERLKSFKTFAGLKEEEIKFIISYLKISEMKQGDIIVDEGYPAPNLYLVLNGRVRIFKKMPGKFVDLAILELNDIFGEVSFVDHMVHSATAEAAENTVLAVLDQDSFKAMKRERPALVLDFIFNLMRELCNKFRAVNLGVNSKSSEYLIYELLASGQEVKIGTSSGVDYIGKIVYSGMSDRFPLIKVQVKDLVTILPFNQITAISLPNKFGKFLN